MSPVTNILLVYLGIFIVICLFIRSATPKGFDQMPESINTDQETEYQDEVKTIPPRNTEPKIRETINV